MKILIGFVAGVAASWAALAIWQNIEGFTEDIDPDFTPEVRPTWIECDHDSWEVFGGGSRKCADCGKILPPEEVTP